MNQPNQSCVLCQMEVRMQNHIPEDLRICAKCRKRLGQRKAARPQFVVAVEVKEEDVMFPYDTFLIVTSEKETYVHPFSFGRDKARATALAKNAFHNWFPVPLHGGFILHVALQSGGKVVWTYSGEDTE